MIFNSYKLGKIWSAKNILDIRILKTTANGVSKRLQQWNWYHAFIDIS